MPKISAPTLEAHRAATIDRLLDAFGELVLKQGYSDVSLADVAAQAGLARTAIYNYFSDRESLLFAWTDREVARTIAILEADIEAAETCSEKLGIFVRQQLLDFASRHLPPGHEVMQFLNPETYGRFMRHIEPVEVIARTIVSTGVKTGEFGPVDPATTVPMIMACIGAERAPIATRAHDVEEATERVTGFLLRALGAKSKPARKAQASKKKASGSGR
ncbi:MAG TPA: TetR/AcrR family transcriptional regulator [Actinomycetota bacterium]|jgi:AcrR family transcriptional regulator